MNHSTSFLSLVERLGIKYLQACLSSRILDRYLSHARHFFYPTVFLKHSSVSNSIFSLLNCRFQLIENSEYLAIHNAYNERTISFHFMYDNPIKLPQFSRLFQPWI